MNCSLSFFFFGQNSLCTAQWRWVIFSWEKNKVNNKLRLVASSKNIYYLTESNGARRWRFKPRANQNINLLKSRTFKPRVFTNFTWYLREVFSALLLTNRDTILRKPLYLFINTFTDTFLAQQYDRISYWNSNGDWIIRISCSRDLKLTLHSVHTPLKHYNCTHAMLCRL